MADTARVSAGVEELIKQIRDEGVQAAREEADRILKNARDQAARMLDGARKETRELKAKTLAEIQNEKVTSEEALKLASRDTILRLGNEVRATFEQYVKRLVAEKLGDEDVLKEVILAIARKAGATLPEDREIILLLGSDPASPDKKISGAAEKKFRQLVLKSTGGMLREGIDLKGVGEKFAGVKIQLKGENIQVDLTDQAIAELLVRHLIPRFRKIMMGQHAVV